MRDSSDELVLVPTFDDFLANFISLVPKKKIKCDLEHSLNIEIVWVHN
jgi:hypothetical protein